MRSNPLHGDGGRNIPGRGSYISKGWESEDSLTLFEGTKKTREKEVRWNWNDRPDFAGRAWFHVKLKWKQ